MSIAYYIAHKLYRFKGEGKKVSQPAIGIATVGVALGLAVMIISISVVLGFKQQIREKVIGFGSHIEVLNLRSVGSPESFPLVTDASLMQEVAKANGVKHVQRFSLKMGMLKTDEQFQGTQFKGVGEEYDLDFLKKHIVEGALPTFSASHHSNKIVISQWMAKTMKLKLGDRVFAYFFEKTIKMRRFTIAGIYRTDMSQFDQSIVLTDLATVNQLNAWQDNQSSGLEILVKNYDQLEATDMNVLAVTNGRLDTYGQAYSALTIKELYPQIFNWLGLLDLNIWVILTLMVCVAGFTMISGLLILILERTNTIGVLKAMGATSTTVRHIFLYYAVFIIGRGLFWGNLIGISLCYIQYQWGLVKLDPENYYLEQVPVLFNWALIIGLNIATFIISMLALIGPSYLITRIQPAKAIRIE